MQRIINHLGFGNNGIRRINTWELKLAVFIAIFISFLLSGNILQDQGLSFGFPCSYLIIYQEKIDNFRLFYNMFYGNRGISVNMLDLFVNIVIAYYIVIFIESIINKFKGNSDN
ncbi:hypothetical protein [uncultured Clostridium sp.]|uniref:hypothetical protein n=1 Tax=uncultured Clostridium sp. TaxID=59620 RepID=UPI0028E8BEDE|nr:hypothetical protein [uncultured Clostridium sp.]